MTAKKQEDKATAGPEVSGTITITKFKDRSIPFQIEVEGIWSVIEVNALERKIQTVNRGHLIDLRNQGVREDD